MPHTPEQHKLWVASPQGRKATREAAKRYYHSKGKAARLFRKELLSEFGCSLCDETCPDCIDWHHLDSNDKEFEIANGKSHSLEKWWNEVLKCIPICANCHRKLHANQLCLIHQISPTG